MAGKYKNGGENRKKKLRLNGKVKSFLIYIMIPLLCGGIFGAWMISRLPNLKYAFDRPENPQQEQEQLYDIPLETEPEETAPPTTETEPVTKISTATIGATGDIMLHDLVIQSGYDKESETYNFDYMFQWFSKYVSQMDYAAANLEVTLAGKDNGYPFAGYPAFNSPDEIVDAAKNAGFDLLLTANNHAYDTGITGLKRTQEVIGERGVDHVGTRPTKNDKRYIVREINGIKVGMICYTYMSGYTNAKNYILSGTSMSTQATPLINAFHYKDLNTFYTNLAKEMEQMNAEGAEVIVAFMHWGTEYELVPNESQKKIAQKLCDMGIDVIVGNHAHVAQPVELLTSTTYDTHKTLCIYSTGNSVSNIYKSSKFPVHTEDGMLFTFTLAKYSDGTVLVESTDVIPTWVHRYDEDGVRKFQILTMAPDADWKAEMKLSDELLAKCQESFDRTMAIVGDGLKAANDWFSLHQAEKETAVGIR